MNARRFILVLVVFAAVAPVGATDPDRAVLKASAWRDFSPPNPGSGLFVSVDLQLPADVKVESVEVVDLKSKEKWDSKLRFVYDLEDGHPEKGQSYHAVGSGPRWGIGDEVTITVRVLDGKKRKTLPGGTVKIGATY